LVPLRPSCSRSTHSNGVSGSASESRTRPLTFRRVIGSPIADRSTDTDASRESLKALPPWRSRVPMGGAATRPSACTSLSSANGSSTRQRRRRLHTGAHADRRWCTTEHRRRGILGRRAARCASRRELPRAGPNVSQPAFRTAPARHCSISPPRRCGPRTGRSRPARRGH
jgi:hypothetical protein